VITAIFANVTIQWSTFIDGGNKNVFGGALFCDCHNLVVTDTKFENNEAAAGGAIYLIGRSGGVVNFSKNFFGNNKAQHGGAINIITADRMFITGNGFTGNRAYVISPPTVASVKLPSSKAQGGAIYFLCQRPYDGKCLVNLQNNNFNANSAENEGGALIFLNEPF